MRTKQVREASAWTMSFCAPPCPPSSLCHWQVGGHAAPPLASLQTSPAGAQRFPDEQIVSVGAQTWPVGQAGGGVGGVVGWQVSPVGQVGTGGVGGCGGTGAGGYSQTDRTDESRTARETVISRIGAS